MRVRRARVAGAADDFTADPGWEGAANRRMRPERFVLYVHVGLIGIGAILLAQAV